MKNPILVGILNAVLPGVGYLIIRERVVFGTFLIAGSVALIILTIIEPVFRPGSLLVSSSILGQGLESLWYTFFVLAYGYDAYALARDKQDTPVFAAPVPETHSDVPNKE